MDGPTLVSSSGVGARSVAEHALAIHRQSFGHGNRSLSHLELFSYPRLQRRLLVVGNREDTATADCQGSSVIRPLPRKIVVFSDLGGRGLQRLLDIHNHRIDLGAGHSLLSFVIRRWTKGGEKSGEGEEEGGGERRRRPSRHTSQRCARPGISLSSKINAREPLFARELGLLSRRPFDSGGPRPIPTGPFGCSLCRLADTWVLRDPS